MSLPLLKQSIGTWFLLVSVIGCDPLAKDPAPKLGSTNWRIRAMQGSLELRPLPPAEKVVQNYKAWLESESPITLKARLYEATLVGASNQLNFNVQVLKGETPLGQSLSTVTTFIYRDPKGGDYELTWGRFGRHRADFLRLTAEPKQVWLQPNMGTNDAGNPTLEIVAFEGLEASRVAAALPGGKRD